MRTNFCIFKYKLLLTDKRQKTFTQGPRSFVFQHVLIEFGDELHVVRINTAVDQTNQSFKFVLNLYRRFANKTVLISIGTSQLFQTQIDPLTYVYGIRENYWRIAFFALQLEFFLFQIIHVVDHWLHAV